MAGEDVFILGAGFSKAIDRGMPTMAELSRDVRHSIDHVWRDEWGADLEGNVELLLTHLATPHPWHKAHERHEALAAYYQIQGAMTEWIRQAELHAAATEVTPEWLIRLCRYWHATTPTVVTFNYDTLVERAANAARLLEGTQVGGWQLYGAPLTRAGARPGYAFLAPERVDTFSLLKLHGSLNWWYSGPEAPPGDMVYVTDSMPKWADLEPQVLTEEDLMADKVRLVVPPTLQKEGFYTNSVLKMQWEMARQRIAEARRIVVMGYSLPLTDLSSRLLISTSGTSAEVEVVDRRGDACLQIQESLPDLHVLQRCSGESAIADWVEANLH